MPDIDDSVPTQDEKRRKRRRPRGLFLAAVVVLALAALSLTVFYGYPLGRAAYARYLLARGDYQASLAIYRDMPPYYDWHDRFVAAYLASAYAAFDSGDLAAARQMFCEEASNDIFTDRRDEMVYMQGCCAEAAGNLEDALALYQACPGFSALDKDSSYTKINEVTLAIAKKLEAENKTIDAYQMYSSIAGKSTEAGSKVYKMKEKMKAEAWDLVNQINASVSAGDFDGARTLADQLDLAGKDYHLMFNQSLMTEAASKQLSEGILEAESTYRTSQLFSQFDADYEAGDYKAAVACLQQVDAIRKDCQSKLKRAPVQEEEISERYYTAAYAILSQTQQDSLKTDMVGHACVKTGSSFDDGKKTNQINQGQNFGLIYSAIKTTAATHVKVYRLEMAYLAAEPREIMIDEGKSCPWVYRGGYYFHYDADGSAEFPAGFYFFELVCHDVLNQDVTIGRFYFQINEASNL